MIAVPDRVVIVGASLAGLSTARALRAQGFAGELIVVGDEVHRPYDRPPLSKEFLHDLTVTVDLSLEGEAEDLDITWKLGVRATGLQALPAGGAAVALSDGTTIDARTVVIATGSSARRSIPGAELAGVHALRTLDDATALRRDLHAAVATHERVLVVGGGFIGSEVAATARQLGCRVTLVVPDDVPLRAALGPFAPTVADLHRAHGVEIVANGRVREVRPAEGGGLEVVLVDGARLTASTVVLGIGASPAVGWLAGAGLDHGAAEGGAVRCDETGATNLPGVYAVGDCAAWFHPGLGFHHQSEHWTSARERGGVVAAHILGADRVPTCRAPYVWSDLYGRRLQLAGYRDLADHPDDLDHTLEVGTLADADFAAVYRRNGEPVAVLALGQTRYFAGVRRKLITPVAAAASAPAATSATVTAQGALA